MTKRFKEKYIKYYIFLFLVLFLNLGNTTNCDITADCKEGYCNNGKCIIPIKEELSQLLWLKSGCSGLFVCPENDLVCFIICNLIWFILIMMASLAGYASKQTKNKLIPFVYFLIPILIGIISVPFAGILVGIIEILSIKYKRLKHIKTKFEEIYVNYLSKKKSKKKNK